MTAGPSGESTDDQNSESHRGRSHHAIQFCFRATSNSAASRIMIGVREPAMKQRPMRTPRYRMRRTAQHRNTEILTRSFHGLSRTEQEFSTVAAAAAANPVAVIVFHSGWVLKCAENEQR